MLILGIDTATTAASAALVEDGKLICEETVSAPVKNGGGPRRGNHSETLLPLIDRLLQRAGSALSNVSAFAVAIGPGSFTGLRIGLSTIKGLSYGADIPVVGIPTLEAVAARVDDYEGFICPLLDARKKEVYAALFHRSGERLERMSEDVVSTPETVVESVRRRVDRGSVLFIGDAVLAYEDTVKAGLGAKGLLTLGEEYPSAAAGVARLAQAKIRRQEFYPIGPLVPTYLRASEAELKKQ